MKHSLYSEELYLNIGNSNDETIEIARAMRHHHENWDGTGYPDRISGEHIPLHSRIIKIADIFEAMTSPRIYRNFKINNTLEIMERMQNKEIDPEIFAKCYEVLNKLLINNQKENGVNWNVQNALSG